MQIQVHEIFGNGTTQLQKRCLCQKAGLKCSSSCGECLGVFCENAVDEQNIADKTEDYFPDRNFLDAFN